MKNYEYLLSRYYLKKLVEAKVISCKELEEIDALNKLKFTSSESH